MLTPFPYTQLLAFPPLSILPPPPGSPPVCFNWITTFRPRDAQCLPNDVERARLSSLELREHLAIPCQAQFLIRFWDVSGLCLRKLGHRGEKLRVIQEGLNAAPGVPTSVVEV